jgi:hypothetical protein
VNALRVWWPRLYLLTAVIKAAKIINQTPWNAPNNDNWTGRIETCTLIATALGTYYTIHIYFFFYPRDLYTASAANRGRTVVNKILLQDNSCDKHIYIYWLRAFIVIIAVPAVSRALCSVARRRRYFHYRLQPSLQYFTTRCIYLHKNLPPRPIGPRKKTPHYRQP